MRCSVAFRSSRPWTSWRRRKWGRSFAVPTYDRRGRWLVRLVTPSGGLVLDPFAGSGTTGLACITEPCRFLGIEREAAYVAIATARLRAEHTRYETGGPLFAGAASG